MFLELLFLPFLFTHLPESPLVPSLALFFSIHCLIDVILITFDFFKYLFIWNMNSSLLMCHCPYQTHSLHLIWSLLKVCTRSDLYTFKRRFPFLFLTFMSCSVFLSILDASMRCSFANYKFHITIKMMFSPGKECWCPKEMENSYSTYYYLLSTQSEEIM